MLNLMDHTNIVRDLTFAPDGSLMLVSASIDKTLRVWDLKDDGMCMNSHLILQTKNDTAKRYRLRVSDLMSAPHEMTLQGKSSIHRSCDP